MSICGLALQTLLGAHDHATWEAFGLVEWLVVGVASAFVAWTIWLAVKYTLKPGEDAPDHHKRLIFRGPDAGANEGRGDE